MLRDCVISWVFSRLIYCTNLTLPKHAYSNILKISPPKTESFQIKTLIFFHISAQNIDCSRGGFNEYHNLCF